MILSKVVCLPCELQDKKSEYGELGEVIFSPIAEQIFEASVRDPSPVVPDKAP